MCVQALLVNAGTASTSEMLAASLHENAHALLIGEHSYGKGRTQRILAMGDGSTLLVSTSLVTTPAFRTIDKVTICHISKPQLAVLTSSPDVKPDYAQAAAFITSAPSGICRYSVVANMDRRKTGTVPLEGIAMHPLRDAPALSNHL